MSREILSRKPVPAQARLPYGKDESQFYDVWNSEGTHGLVMMIHGGFWRSQFDLTNASHLCAALAEDGVVVASVEYRRTGPTGGGWPQTFGDVLTAYDAIEQRFHGSKPLVIGHSAGGHLALRLASEREDAAGIVALAPVACLDLAFERNLGSGAVVDFLGGSPAEMPERYEAADPSRHPANVARLCIHGTNDDVVPLAISEAFVERRRTDSPAARLTEIPEADHFDLIDPLSTAWPKVSALVMSALRNR